MVRAGKLVSAGDSEEVVGGGGVDDSEEVVSSSAAVVSSVLSASLDVLDGAAVGVAEVEGSASTEDSVKSGKSGACASTFAKKMNAIRNMSFVGTNSRLIGRPIARR
jgi:hypothetical protein